MLVSQLGSSSAAMPVRPSEHVTPRHQPLSGRSRERLVEQMESIQCVERHPDEVLVGWCAEFAGEQLGDPRRTVMAVAVAPDGGQCGVEAVHLLALLVMDHEVASYRLDDDVPYALHGLHAFLLVDG